MTTRDIIGLAIVSVVAVVLIIIAILLLLGKGSSLIAGYNTSDDKEKYDTSKLTIPTNILNVLTTQN